MSSLFRTIVLFEVLLGKEFVSNVSSIFLLVSVLDGIFSKLTVKLLNSSTQFLGRGATSITRSVFPAVRLAGCPAVRLSRLKLEL